jgi:hypothetical protein
MYSETFFWLKKNISGKFEPSPKLVLEQVVLDVKRVLHLVELLSSTDHVGHHDFGLRPRKILVYWEILLPKMPSEMIGQSQKLCKTHFHAGGPQLLLNIDGGVDGNLVVSGNHDLSLRHLHHFFEVCEVVVSGRVEVSYHGRLVVALPCQPCFFDEIGSSD